MPFIWINQERRQTICLWWLAVENVHQLNSSFFNPLIHCLHSLLSLWILNSALMILCTILTFQTWECNLWKRPGFVQFTVISFLLPEYCLDLRLSPWSLPSSVLAHRGWGILSTVFELLSAWLRQCAFTLHCRVTSKPLSPERSTFNLHSSANQLWG